MEDFVQIRLFVYFGTKSSTFGAFFPKILHFWLRKLEKPPLLVVFFSKVRILFRIDFQSSTFGAFFSPKSSTFGYENLDFLIPQSATRCKNTSKSLPSLIFWWTQPVLQVSSRLEHFEFFWYQGSPLWIIFPNFDKMQKSCIFCFSRYGPHFLTQYSELAQEQF